jgi:hypothetical protein
MTQREMYHIVNGLWAGIPWCCIMFWHNGNTGVTRKTSDPWAETAQYVRCDTCIARRHFIKIRKNGAVLQGLIKHNWYNKDNWWLKI